MKLYPRGGDGAFDHHLRPNLRTLAMMPPENERAGNINTGVGSGDDADEESEREVIDCAAAEKIKRCRGDKDRAGSDDGAAQGLIERLIDELGEAAAHAEFQIFTYAVKDNNGVVDGETDDGQNGGNH